MAERLQDLVLVVDVSPDTYDRRAPAAPPRAPDDDAVKWESSAQSPYRDRYDHPWSFRFALPATNSRYVLDADAGGDRTVETPRVTASAVRAWRAIEPLTVEPTGTTVTYRILDVTADDDLYWDGAAWSTAGAGDWTTEADLVANFSALPDTIRSISLVVRLGTTNAKVTPQFLGFVVAYGVRAGDDGDDALLRTFVPELKTALRFPLLVQTDTGSGLSSLRLVGGDSEHEYQVQSVLAAYNVTDDPNLQTELPGTWDGATWTPTTPLPASKTLELQVEVAPDIVVSRHQDVELLARLPAVHIRPVAGGGDLVNADLVGVRDRHVTPPTEQAMGARSGVRTELRVRLIGELESGVVRRLARELRQWFGRSRQRLLISPETAQPVSATLVEPARESDAALSSGMAEAVAAVRLTHGAVADRTLTEYKLVKTGGVTTVVEGR